MAVDSAKLCISKHVFFLLPPRGSTTTVFFSTFFLSVLVQKFLYIRDPRRKKKFVCLCVCVCVCVCVWNSSSRAGEITTASNLTQRVSKFVILAHGGAALKIFLKIFYFEVYKSKKPFFFFSSFVKFQILGTIIN